MSHYSAEEKFEPRAYLPERKRQELSRPAPNSDFHPECVGGWACEKCLGLLLKPVNPAVYGRRK